MSLGGLFAGTHTYLVGVEDGPDDALKVYLGHRSRGLYALVTDDGTKDRIRRAWAGNGVVTITVPPPECVFSDDDPVTAPPPVGTREQEGGTER